MAKRNYTHLQPLLPVIKTMHASGMTHREIAEHFGFKDKFVVKRLLTRERNKKRNIMNGIMPRPKGRPRKNTTPMDLVTEQAYEIARLKRELALLQDFIQLTERM